jgi:hypothetical protein
VLGAAAGDDGLDAALAELAAVLVVVVAAVGDELFGSLARSPASAADRPHAIEQRQELGDVVAMAAAQRDLKRDAVGVGQEVVL